MSKVVVALLLTAAAAAVGASAGLALKPASPPQAAQPLQAAQPQPVQPQQGIPVPPGPGIPPGVYPVLPISMRTDPCAGEYYWQGVPANQPRHVPVFPPRWGHLSGASFLGSDGLTYYETCYDS